jgi:5-methylcytosine-specific restriction protein A
MTSLTPSERAGTGRSVPEWIGKTPDSVPPPHVRVRIFDAHNGICHRSKRKIQAGELWQVDHVKALVNGGENRESNMAPILTDKHREKTAEDVAEKSRIYRKRAKHLGVKTKSRSLSHPTLKRKMDGTVVAR